MYPGQSQGDDRPVVSTAALTATGIATSLLAAGCIFLLADVANLDWLGLGRTGEFRLLAAELGALPNNFSITTTETVRTTVDD
jgi:hypothetical protein